MDKKRSRIISFRLSPDEYESLRNHSRSNGSRSISEFTRSVACKSAANNEPEEAEKLDMTLKNLNSVVNVLAQQVQRLSNILDAPEKRENPENKNS